MNVKDYTLKVQYELDGRLVAITENDDVLSFEDKGGEIAVKIVMRAKKPVRIKLAELIYDNYFDSDEWFFANGYQSWTTSREYKRGDTQYGLRKFSKFGLGKKFAGACGDYAFTEYGKDLFHSFTYTYLRIGEKVNFLGSLNERTGYTIFYADVRENVFAVIKDLEGVTISSEYEIFDLIFFEGGYDEVFDKYFDALPNKNPGRVEHYAGYTSWYNYFQNIDENIIDRDLEGLKRAGAAANVFQIDDGYETMVGDWTLDKKKFPGGMKPIVDKIHSLNLRAGLWVAPFSAQYKAEICKKHPDWMIKKNGRNLFGGVGWGGFYVLDIEKREVRDYIKAFFDKVFDEWGFDMVKLDFLYSACIIPRNNKTRGQLMCEAMDFLRECCRDKVILGCGVPLGPSFGVVDACRISCDVELNFKDKFYVSSTNQEIISARNAMNNSIFRRHLNGRIFANDPDVFFLRNDGAKPAKFTWEQKKLLAKVNNMFGSVLFVSDDVNNYDGAQLKLLLEAYKKFEGKVISAEYVSKDKIEIVYELNKETHKFKFDAYSGVNSDKIIEKA